MHKTDIIKLPEPRYTSDTSIEEAILRRRSKRKYKDEPLSALDVSQLLWAAQGITREERGLRAAPSAGALYPIETYLVAGNVNDIPKGVYKYSPKGHELTKVIGRDIRHDLVSACAGQWMLESGAFTIVFAVVYERMTARYGKRGLRYVHMDVAHAAENVYLQAVALNLGTVDIGAFDDNAVKQLLQLPDEEDVLLLMPVGRINER